MEAKLFIPSLSSDAAHKVPTAEKIKDNIITNTKIILTDFFLNLKGKYAKPRKMSGVMEIKKRIP